MGAEANTKTVHEIYEAFGRGDIQAVLDALAEDVDWATETSSTVAPWYGVRHGKDGVADFFEAFGSTMQVQEFNPYAFAANDSEVHTVVHCRYTNRKTGKGTEYDLHHFFRFRDGKIVFHRSTEDTAQTEAAFRP